MPRCKSCGRRSSAGKNNPDWKCSFCEEIERQVNKQKKHNRKYSHAYYLMHKDKIREHHHKYYVAHKDKFRKYREQKRRERIIKQYEELMKECKNQ